MGTIFRLTKFILTKQRNVPSPHLATAPVKASVDGKVRKSAIKVTHPLSITVNQHAFHSFGVRNHTGIGPLGHFIIATAPALQ